MYRAGAGVQSEKVVYGGPIGTLSNHKRGQKSVRNRWL